MVSFRPCLYLIHHCLHCHLSSCSARYPFLLLHMSSNIKSVSELFCLHSCGLYLIIIIMMMMMAMMLMMMVMVMMMMICRTTLRVPSPPGAPHTLIAPLNLWHRPLCNHHHHHHAFAFINALLIIIILASSGQEPHKHLCWF